MPASYELDQLAAAAQRATAALDQLDTASGRGGIGGPDGGFAVGAGGVGGGGSGNVSDLALGAILSRFGGAGAAALGVASGALNSGLGEAARTFAGYGDFNATSSGLSGSFQRGQTSFLASIPILGDLLGASQVNDVTNRVESRLNGYLDDYARAGIEVDPSVRRALREQFTEEEQRVEESRQAVRRSVGSQASQDQLDNGSVLEAINEGLSDALAPVVAKADEAISLLGRLVGLA